MNNFLTDKTNTNMQKAQSYSLWMLGHKTMWQIYASSVFLFKMFLSASSEASTWRCGYTVGQKEFFKWEVVNTHFSEIKQKLWNFWATHTDRSYQEEQKKNPKVTACFSNFKAELTVHCQLQNYNRFEEKQFIITSTINASLT